LHWKDSTRVRNLVRAFAMLRDPGKLGVEGEISGSESSFEWRRIQATQSKSVSNEILVSRRRTPTSESRSRSRFPRGAAQPTKEPSCKCASSPFECLVERN
jgi:hypothetical protein